MMKRWVAALQHADGSKELIERCWTRKGAERVARWHALRDPNRWVGTGFNGSYAMWPKPLVGRGERS